MNSETNPYNDPEREAQWIKEQHARVVAYLEDEDIERGELPEEPEWCLAPYIALWAVKSAHDPNAIGGWIISGDLPTDYLSSAIAADARSAMRAFGAIWLDVADHMLRGQPHPDVRLGTPDRWPMLGELLQRRAKLLWELTHDDSLWE